MFNNRTLKLGLPVFAAAVAIGCAGSNGGGGTFSGATSTGGSTNGGSSNGGGTNGGGGGTGADSVDLTIARNGSNGRYTSLKATNGSTKIVAINDSNPTGAGTITIIANVPEGATGRTQGLQLQFNHAAALEEGTTFSPTDPGDVVYSEIRLNLSNPADAETKSWQATTGSIEFTQVTATRATVRFNAVGCVPTGAGVETGNPTLSGTASGTFATE